MPHLDVHELAAPDAAEARLLKSYPDRTVLGCEQTMDLLLGGNWNEFSGQGLGCHSHEHALGCTNPDVSCEVLGERPDAFGIWRQCNIMQRTFTKTLQTIGLTACDPYRTGPRSEQSSNNVWLEAFVPAENRETPIPLAAEPLPSGADPDTAVPIRRHAGHELAAKLLFFREDSPTCGVSRHKQAILSASPDGAICILAN